jgi:hypothetical protein
LGVLGKLKGVRMSGDREHDEENAVTLVLIVILIALALCSSYEYLVGVTENTDYMIRWCSQVRGINITSHEFCEYCAEEFLERMNTTKKEFLYYCPRGK